jgi:HEAT repeat protein/beta-lactamase regulating signal transducer with metallopeptidase domain
VLLTIIDIVVKASVVLTMAALVAAALRRASASTRHFVWTLGMVGALAAPLLSATHPKWEVPIVRVQAEQPSVAASEAPALQRGQTPSAAALGSDPGRAITHSGVETGRMGSDPGRSVTHSRQLALASVPWTTVLLMAWGAGALLILGRVLLGLIAVQWMARRTPQVTDAPWLPLANELTADLGLRRVRFMRARTASMPMAWGVLRPSVLMPADADAWPSDRLRIVLLHELAHVKRRDCLTHLFAQIAFAAYWFNPLAWIAARNMRTERERACDDLVLAAGTRGSDYADQLLDIARVMRAGRFPAVLAGASLAMAHRSQLEGRLMAILDPTIPRRALGRVRAGLVLATFALLVVPVAAVQPWAQDAAAQGGNGQQPDAAITKTQVKADTSVDRETDQKVVVKHDDQKLPQDGVPGGVAGGVPGGVPGGVVGGVISSVVNGVGNGIAEGIANGVSNGVAAGVAAAQAHPMPMPMPMQTNAARGKGERDPRTVDALIEALKDSDKGVRETAMSALSHIRDPRLFDAFAAALKDSNPDVREQAAFGLGQLRDKRAIAPLTQVLKDEKADVREQAVFALGQLRAVEAIDGLTLALRDPNGSVREQAAFALGQLRDSRSVDPLTSALKDENADVREQAAFALGQLRSASAVEALVIALKDPNADVREQVAFALGQIRDPRAIDGLTIALKDPNPSVRQQAAFALGQIRN